MFLSELSSGSAVGFIIPIDRLDAFNCFLYVTESDEPFSCGQRSLKPRRLGEHWFATGEIMGRAITKPTRAPLDIGVFGNADLGSGSRNVVLITREISDLGRFLQKPSIVFEQQDARIVLAIASEGDLHLLFGLARQLGEAFELFVLRPIPLTAKAQITKSSPRGDGRKTAARRIDMKWPLLRHNGWKGVTPLHAAIRYRSVWSADVETHRKEDIMLLEV